MLFLFDEKTLAHETVEVLGANLIPALESPARITEIVRHIEAHDSGHEILHTGDSEQGKKWDVDWLEVRERAIGLVKETHEEGYIHHLRTCHEEWVKAGHITPTGSILPECFPFNATGTHSDPKPPGNIFARTGFYAFDMSTGIMSGTYDAVIAGAIVACTAASLTHQHSQPIFALCRPPGHHCDTKRAGGYCYVNNAVLAVEYFLKYANIHDLEVGILDLDFHHGNGTQAKFYEREVHYVSIHDTDEYPYYSGFESERGSKQGLGYNDNLVVKRECGIEQYLVALEKALTRLFRRQEAPRKLKFLVVSLGFDTHRGDPLGSFNLDIQDYEVVARRLQSTARTSETNITILLEGGYVVEDLGACVESFCRGLEA